MPPLTSAESERYSRHLSLPGFDPSHQEALKNASVLVVGAGGLGAPVLLYLAAAGVGRIGIIDDDRVELSNLQRQVVHSETDLGRHKAESAAESVHALNSSCKVDVHLTRLDSSNAIELVGQYDLVVDGTDNLPTRYLTNDACVLTGRPLIYGSVFRFEGQVSVFGVIGGPCYRCLFPTPPPPELVPSCEAAGVLGIVPGLIGMYQASEAIKVICNLGKPMSGRLLMIDLLSNRQRQLVIERDPACPLCGDQPTITQLDNYEIFCGYAVESLINPSELDTLLRNDSRGVLLVDVRENDERAAGNIGGVHICLGSLENGIGDLAAVAEGKHVVFYCRSGGRSGTAARIASRAGIKNVLSLDGGLKAWKRDVDPDVVVR